jgi:hypothetical protein
LSYGCGDGGGDTYAQPGTGGNGGTGGGKGGSVGTGGDSSAGESSGSGGTSSAGKGGEGGDGLGGAPAAPCDLGAPFGAPVLMPAVNDMSNDGDARLSGDELNLYFSSDRDGVDRDLFHSTRSSKDDDFGEPMPLDLVNSDALDAIPTVTADDQTLYFISDRSGTPRIYSASRSTPVAAFSDPVLVDNVSVSATGEWSPFVSADGLTLYFTADPDADCAGSPLECHDILRATRTTGTFGTPEEVTELNTVPYAEAHPTLTSDELTIYFGSNRPDGNAEGGADIWMATRGSTDDPFDNVSRVAELSSANEEVPTWISPDGCRMFLEILVDNEWHLYTADKP